MKETLEQVIAYMRGIWRYHWLAMGVAWIIVLLGWAALFYLLSPSYTARAQIYVDAETVLRPLLKGVTVDIDPSAQLGLMARQLMSRPVLERVVQEVGLDRQELLGVALEKLRENISLEAERTSSDARFINFYTISYVNKNPQLAEEVVQVLITAFINNSSKELRRDANRAKEFIDQKIAEYKEKLAVSENRFQEFRRKHVSILPERGKSFFESLQSAQAALKEIDLQIREIESRRNELQTQLAKTSAVKRATSADGKPVLTPVEARLLELRTKLDELLLKFTEAHPDVIETRASIAELERQRREEIRSGISGPTEANPIYQQLQLKLADVEGELAGSQTKLEEYRNRVQVLQQQLETLPEVEAELQRLTRDYEANKSNFTYWMERQRTMEISERVEQADENQKFRIIEPPAVPVSAELDAFRKRQLTLTTGILFAGLGVGFGLAFVLSQIRPAVFSQRALSEITELPVFGVISRVPTLAVRMRRRLGLTAFATTGLMLFVAYGIVLSVQLNIIDLAEMSGLDGVLKSLGGDL